MLAVEMGLGAKVRVVQGRWEASWGSNGNNEAAGDNDTPESARVPQGGATIGLLR